MMLLVEGRRSYDHLSFWDIDDTIFRTRARVNVMRGKGLRKRVVRSLSNAEYNSYRLGPGETFDYGQFRNAAFFRATSVAISGSLERVKKQLGASDTMVVLLTARGSFDSNRLFKDALREHGINVNATNLRLELTGNLKRGTVPERKLYVIEKFMARFSPSMVSIYDDHRENVDLLDDLSKKHPEVEFRKHLVVNGRIRRVGR